MKATSTIPSQFFFKNALPANGGFWLPAPRPMVSRARRVPSIENDDDLARKQEIVCGVILALCLLATVVLCFCQLAS